MAGTEGRKRCACRRWLLELSGAPLVEATSTVHRIRHTLTACEPYRTTERRAPPESPHSP